MFQIELMQTRGSSKGMFIRGTCGILPSPGRTFGAMFGQEDDRQVIQTTTVLSVDELDEAILFETSNSSYLLRIVEIAQESVA